MIKDRIFAGKVYLCSMEKKILIIPDVHGRRFWRDAIHTDDYDKVIFLGDYLDPYPQEHIGPLTAQHGLEDIMYYYDKHPDKVVLLLGNHDMHYLSERYRDFSMSDRYNEEFSDYYYFLFNKGDRFKLAHEETIGGRKYLFTHAGVTMPWLKQNKDIIGEPDAEHLNRLLLTDKGIEALAQVGLLRGGMYLNGSMVWCDCIEMAMSDPIPDVYQIVGHSQQVSGIPVITPHFACLDCRSAFVLDGKGKLKIVNTSQNKNKNVSLKPETY